MDESALRKAIDNIRKKMEKAASELNFIEAAKYRDEMYELEKILKKKAK
jgi:excinuclease ABC subunit B